MSRSNGSAVYTFIGFYYSIYLWILIFIQHTLIKSNLINACRVVQAEQQRGEKERIDALK